MFFSNVFDKEYKSLKSHKHWIIESRFKFSFILLRFGVNGLKEHIRNASLRYFCVNECSCSSLKQQITPLHLFAWCPSSYAQLATPTSFCFLPYSFPQFFFSESTPFYLIFSLAISICWNLDLLNMVVDLGIWDCLGSLKIPASESCCWSLQIDI